MKTTHTILDIENLLHEYAIKIQNAETKTERQALWKKLKQLERHYNTCKEKETNGKKYPKKVIPKDIPKKELLALIDSVETIETVGAFSGVDALMETRQNRQLDVSGVFTSDDRTEDFTRTSILDSRRSLEFAWNT